MVCEALKTATSTLAAAARLSSISRIPDKNADFIGLTCELRTNYIFPLFKNTWPLSVSSIHNYVHLNLKERRELVQHAKEQRQQQQQQQW